MKNPIPSAVLAVAVLLAAGPVTAETGDTMLILDGSGSMWGRIDGRAKIEIAREVVGEVLGDLPPEKPLGLMAYGHRREADCEDIEVLVPVGLDTIAPIRARVEAVTPRGKTPIGATVLEAAQAMDYTRRKATVILVSDGIETCGVDLCRLAELLATEGFDFTAHIIGFDLDEAEGATLACLASGTDGRFLAAANADQLAEALQQTMTPATVPTGDDKDRATVRDIEVRGSDAIFLAGRDDVTVPPRGPETNAAFLLRRHDSLPEPLLETFPPSIALRGGDVVRILDLAAGSIHFFPTPAQGGWGPAGGPAGTSEINPLGGISGYRGPRGPLLGVFLDDRNPAEAEPPPTLDFVGDAPGSGYTRLAPSLRQVFYIGDGTTDETGVMKEITAPPGATRLFLGIADGWGFSGAPGYYDDNDGRYTVRVAVNGVPRVD